VVEDGTWPLRVFVSEVRVPRRALKVKFLLDAKARCPGHREVLNPRSGNVPDLGREIERLPGKIPGQDRVRGLSQYGGRVRFGLDARDVMEVPLSLAITKGLNL
jgi:hypothetical protein